MFVQQWQQAGRAGRRSRDSLIVFVADPVPIDQYYVKNPGQLFEKVSDDLIVDLESKVILEGRTMVTSTSFPLTPFSASPSSVCRLRDAIIVGG